MPRPTKHKVGTINGKLEIIEVISNNISGKHVSLKCLCHACNTFHFMENGNLFHKMKSCGCQQRNSDTWKRKGAINRPWQLPPGEAARKNILRQYKRSASKRNIFYDLSEEDFNRLLLGACYYCGDFKSNTKKGQGKTSGDFEYNGIDRIDSTLGYIKGNTVSCCWKCNNMKSSLSEKEFIEHITKIYKYNKKEEE